QPPAQPLATPPPSKPSEAVEGPSDEEEDGEGDESEEEDEGGLEDTDDELESEEGEDEETEELGAKKGNGVEDRFLKMKDLEKFMEEGEEQEYGGGSKGGEKKKASVNLMEDDSDEEDVDEDDGGDDEDDDLDLEDFESDDEEGVGKSGGDIRYEDFFEESSKQQVKKRNGFTKKVHFKDELHEMEVDDIEKDDVNDGPALEDEQGLSTHEKGLLKMRNQIDLMEKASLEPSKWIMQGEVDASRRPKNSALEVDLDFEHNVRPAPVITEEVTASLEEMIKKRIAEV
uniref:Uncharacterized protein n=1 Tax=Aegilops tauschii subsp. strangulata TaxID=200361 RepID=A0A453KBQ6_AEGTS